MPEPTMRRKFPDGSIMEPLEGPAFMASLTLKGMPDSLLKRLRQLAEANRRSLNREVIDRLERSIAGRRVDPDALLARLDALRARMDLKPLDDLTIRKAKRMGRT